MGLNVKITDYGIWFFMKDGRDCWTKTPTIDSSSIVYFNGIPIGCDGWRFSTIEGLNNYVFGVDITCLARIGFQIKPDLLGQSVFAHGGHRWYFQHGHIPSESDFEEIQ